MSRVVDKFRDTTARKPSGWLGKRLYKDPKGHHKSFRIIMEKLNLRSHDSYLEVACGGGVLLEMALKTVSRAAGIDHSADMVELATQRNLKAVDRGIVEIVAGKAESLPWPDESFSCAACANAFFFFEHPELVLKEIHRVLKPRGRLAMTTASAKRSVASIVFSRPYALKAYPEEQMQSMLHQAGFGVAEVNESNRAMGMQVCLAQKP